MHVDVLQEVANGRALTTELNEKVKLVLAKYQKELERTEEEWLEVCNPFGIDKT